jgi:alkaline phosphatase
LELVTKGVDFFAGGGKIYFDQRTDGLNLIDTLLVRNYQITGDLSQVTGDKKTAVFIADNIPVSYLDGRGDVLPQAVSAALNQLKKNNNGFFMMIEGAQIDWAGEDNNQDYLMAEMLDFDRAVGRALDFAEADGNTLVIITGDHETGGYALTDGNLAENTVQGQFVTWLHTGTMVPVFAFGPGEEEFTGVYENTELFYKFLDFFALDQ